MNWLKMGHKLCLSGKNDGGGKADHIDIEGFKSVVYENSEGKRFTKHVDKPSNNSMCLDTKQCSYKQSDVTLRMAGATVIFTATVYVLGQARGMGMCAFWSAQKIYAVLGLSTWKACPTVSVICSLLFVFVTCIIII